jgi:hypothetical protein
MLTATKPATTPVQMPITAEQKASPTAVGGQRDLQDFHETSLVGLIAVRHDTSPLNRFPRSAPRKIFAQSNRKSVPRVHGPQIPCYQRKKQRIQQ